MPSFVWTTNHCPNYWRRLARAYSAPSTLRIWRCRRTQIPSREPLLFPGLFLLLLRLPLLLEAPGQGHRLVVLARHAHRLARGVARIGDDPNRNRRGASALGALGGSGGCAPGGRFCHDLVQDPACAGGDEIRPGARASRYALIGVGCDSIGALAMGNF